MKKALILSLFLIVMLTFVAPALAQDDGRVDWRPGDRVVLYCKGANLEVWGVSKEGNGVYLTNISYADLLSPGIVTVLLGDNGIIEADAQTTGMIDVRWIGGRYSASGFGDFAKWISCDLPAIIIQPVITPTTTDTTTPDAATQVTISQQINVTDGTTEVAIDQTIAVTTPDSKDTACGSRTYTVKTGDNLFRIALRFGTTVEALAACNNIANPARIYVGQRIHVP